METDPRYCIYKLINRKVRVQIPLHLSGEGNRVYEGLATKVYRDVLNGEIQVTVNDHVMKFRNPTRYAITDTCIALGYGEGGELTDANFYAKLRSMEVGSTPDDVMKNENPNPAYDVIFSFT